MKRKIKLLMHTQPNFTSFNAQDLNGREISSRLNEDYFEIYFLNTLDCNIDEKVKKKNIHIINLYQYPKYIKKILVYYNKLVKQYDISFYIRVFKSESIFLKYKKFFDRKRITIYMVENLLPYLAGKSYNKRAKYNALHSDYIFSISKAVKKSVKKYYGIDTPIIPVGVDTNKFKTLKNKPKNKRLRIVSCGTFQERKQPLLFAKYAKKFPDCDFFWIGEGALEQTVDEFKQKEQLDNLKLLNNMPHEELAKFFANSDIFLFPSIHEGFPKVVVESMAAGLPSIVFDNYKPEAVLDGKTGFVIEDEEEMDVKLRLLIQDENLRKKLSSNAVKRAKEYDWVTITRKWEAILKGIIDGNFAQ